MAEAESAKAAKKEAEAGKKEAEAGKKAAEKEAELFDLVCVFQTPSV